MKSAERVQDQSSAIPHPHPPTSLSPEGWSYRYDYPLLGACVDCSMSHMTLRAGLEQALKVAAPEVLKVEAVEE